MSNFRIQTEGRAFYIFTCDRPEWSYTFHYGNPLRNLEIVVSTESSRILYLESMYFDRVYEDLAVPPGPEDLEMYRSGRVLFKLDFPANDHVSNFFLNLHGDVLDILLCDDPGNLVPDLFCQDGRVEYYYDADDVLIYIRIRDLSPEEIAYFRSYIR